MHFRTHKLDCLQSYFCDRALSYSQTRLFAILFPRSCTFVLANSTVCNLISTMVHFRTRKLDCLQSYFHDRALSYSQTQLFAILFPRSCTFILANSTVCNLISMIVHFHTRKLNCLQSYFHDRALSYSQTRLFAILFPRSCTFVLANSTVCNPISMIVHFHTRKLDCLQPYFRDRVLSYSQTRLFAILFPRSCTFILTNSTLCVLNYCGLILQASGSCKMLINKTHTKSSNSLFCLYYRIILFSPSPSPPPSHLPPPPPPSPPLPPPSHLM